VNCKLLFVYGSDDFLVDRRARVLYDAHCESGEIFNFEPKSDVRRFIGEVCEHLITVPMFTATNSAWIRGINFFYGAESEEVKICISGLLDRIKRLDCGAVIISACPVDRRTKLFKELSQLAECYDVTDASSESSGEFIRGICAENGVKISDEAAASLQSLLGKDARMTQLELEKLASYIGEDRDTITLGDVNLLVDPANGGEFFQQIESFYSPNIDEKLSAIKRYFYFTGEARPLIAGLQNRTRIMIQLRALVDGNRIQLGRPMSKTQLENLSKLFNANVSEKNSYNVFAQNTWYLGKLLGSLERYSLHRLLDIQLALMDAIAETGNRCDDQAAVIGELSLKF
jgi:DNA polymerase-3 subunit delta